MRNEYDANEAMSRAVASRRTWHAPIPSPRCDRRSEGRLGALLAVLIGAGLASALFFWL